MKKILFLYFLLINCCFAETDPSLVIYYKNPLLTRRVGWFFDVGNFIQLNKGKSVVMIGDSLIARIDWEKFLNRSGISNAGLGGETSALALERIDVILSINPKLAFFMIGINDFYRDASVDTVFQNISNIMKRLQEAGVQVILLSTPHCNSNKAAIQQYSNTAIQQYSKHTKTLNASKQTAK